MRVTVWGINYAPEFTGIAPHNVALCEFLRARGDEVEMLTTFSYYPGWHKQPEDRGLFYRTDEINGVRVRRCWHYVPARVSALKRIAHEATFVLTSTVRALSLPRPDVFVVVSPPLLLGAAAWLVGKIKGVPFIFHVQDMQPDAAVGLGMLKESAFTRALYRLEAFAYKHAARVSGITRGMLDTFRRKGVAESKLIYFPNAIALRDEAAAPAGQFRRLNGFGEDEFVAVYAGNLGVKQGLDILIDAAQLVRDSRIRIVICGDGAQRDVLAARITTLQLANVRMLPLQQGKDYDSLLRDADICFITQQAGTGTMFFPSKLLGLLAFSKPVITVASPESELAVAVQQGEFGINLPPGQPTELARAIDELANDHPRLQRFGRAGRVYVQQFDKRAVLESFARDLDALVFNKPTAAE